MDAFSRVPSSNMLPAPGIFRKFLVALNQHARFAEQAYRTVLLATHLDEGNTRVHRLILFERLTPFISGSCHMKEGTRVAYINSMLADLQGKRLEESASALLKKFRELDTVVKPLIDSLQSGSTDPSFNQLNLLIPPIRVLRRLLTDTRNKLSRMKDKDMPL